MQTLRVARLSDLDFGTSARHRRRRIRFGFQTQQVVVLILYFCFFFLSPSRNVFYRGEEDRRRVNTRVQYRRVENYLSFLHRDRYEARRGAAFAQLLTLVRRVPPRYHRVRLNNILDDTITINWYIYIFF